MKKRNVKKSLDNKKRLGIVIALLAVLGGVGIYSINVNNNVKAWSDKIYPGVKIEGVNLAGKNKKDAEDILKKEFSDKIVNKKLMAKAEGKSIEVKYADLEPKYDIEKAVKEALNTGKNSNIYSENNKIKKGIDKDIKLDFSYNKDKVKTFEEKLKAKANRAPKNAKLTINGGSMNITDGANGRKINDEQMSKIINDSINGKLSEEITVEIPMEDEAPKLKRDDLAKVNGIIGSFSTDFPTWQTSGREQNLTSGASKLNGTTIAPGDEFSFNDTVGKRTAEAGFGIGGVYKGSKLVDEVGGGICQVSTTLYRAVMDAGIRSTERYNHSFKPSYSDYGLDATVYYGSLDYKFKNTYKSPIYIESYAQNKKVVFNIYGNTSEKGNKTYEMVADPVKNIGNDKVQTTSYFITKQGGQEISREKIATDVYGTKLDR